MKKMTIILGFVLASLMVLTTSCGSPSTPGDTLKAFSYAMEQGNDTEVLSMLALGDEEMSEKDREKLVALIGSAKEEIAKKGGIESIEILEETISEDGNSAKIKAKTTYGNGTDDEGSSKLKLVDGDWKISF